MHPQLLFTVKEAQQILGVSKNHVYRLMRRGFLDTTKLGGCRKITAASLFAAAKASKEGGQ